MKLTRADLRQLKLPIAAAAVLIMLGAGCVVASDRYLAQARNARETAKVQRIEAQKRVERVAEEEQEIRQNLVYYQDMNNHGMAVEESRLDLIDSITRIKNERKLFEIRYQVEPQKPLAYAGMRPAGALDLAASRLKLDMLLLHEQDLLEFLDDLEKSGKVYVSVRSCSISRADSSATPALAVTPKLRSSCLVDLVALKLARPS